MPPPVSLKYIVLTCLKISETADPSSFQGVSSETELAEFDSYTDAQKWIYEREADSDLYNNDEEKKATSHYRIVPTLR